MRVRVALGLGLLLAYGWSWGAIYAWRTSALPPTFLGQNEIREFDSERFRCLQPSLPVPCRLGYVEDPLLPGLAIEPRFYLTQYSLAPAVLVGDPALSVVLGNFRRPFWQPSPPAGYRYRVLRDCGNGARLFACEPEP